MKSKDKIKGYFYVKALYEDFYKFEKALIDLDVDAFKVSYKSDPLFGHRDNAGNLAKPETILANYSSTNLDYNKIVKRLKGKFKSVVIHPFS